MTSRVAVIADVHGNRWALEAVLEDIDRRGGPRVLNLGDSVYGPLDPAGSAELLRRAVTVSVRGNQDRILLEPDEITAESPTFHFVAGQLSVEDVVWLGQHEIAPVRDGALALCHGTPKRDDRYLIERVTEHGVVQMAGDALADELAAVDAEIVLCGHSHVPRLIGLPDGRLAVNPGSVGLPAYTEDTPFPHAMEAGSPHARYVLLERTDTGWNVEHVAVDYDWERAAATAAHHGRADWASWLRTGRAKRRPADAAPYAFRVESPIVRAHVVNDAFFRALEKRLHAVCGPDTLRTCPLDRSKRSAGRGVATGLFDGVTW